MVSPPATIIEDSGRDTLQELMEGPHRTLSSDQIEGEVAIAKGSFPSSSRTVEWTGIDWC